MRWEALFADLEGEADAELAAERRAEVADRSRTELGRLRLIDRLQPAMAGGGHLKIGVAGHEVMAGTLRALGPEWLLIEGAGAQETLVPLVAVQWVQGGGGAAAEPGWEGLVGARLGLRVALRRIVRDRSKVQLTLTAGDSFTGRLTRVGADHVELESAERAAERERDGREPDRRIVPLAAIASVRRRSDSIAG